MEIKIKNFSLKHTLESGQFFRYEQTGEWYRCFEREKRFRIKQTGNLLEFKGVNKKYVRQLFGLNADYVKIITGLGKDKKLLPALNYAKGLRIMQRDPWETLISFQCSVMSNIKKIQLNVKLLSEAFGKGSFPEPGQINNLQKIKKCATGFRAEWIHQTNDLVDDTYFTKLRRMKYENAVSELIRLPGVGKKVADCVCLFGLGKTEAFPVDVWMARVMQEKYKVDRNVPEFARSKWGKHAGWAQQYLYHWSRNGYA